MGKTEKEQLAYQVLTLTRSAIIDLLNEINSMKVYQTKWFERWARKQGLRGSDLCNAVEEMASGLYEANLGGGLFKKRIARAGQGKRGGFRTLLVTNLGDCWFFVYGFPKNEPPVKYPGVTCKIWV